MAKSLLKICDKVKLKGVKRNNGSYIVFEVVDLYYSERTKHVSKVLCRCGDFTSKYFIFNVDEIEKVDKLSEINTTPIKKRIRCPFRKGDKLYSGRDGFVTVVHTFKSDSDSEEKENPRWCLFVVNKRNDGNWTEYLTVEELKQYFKRQGDM